MPSVKLVLKTFPIVLEGTCSAEKGNSEAPAEAEDAGNVNWVDSFGADKGTGNS